VTLNMSAILGLLSDRKLGSLDFQGLYAGNNSIFDKYSQEAPWRKIPRISFGSIWR
jgi:hypothetical protein